MTTTVPTANVTLDVKGATCPGPLVGAKRIVDDLAEGQVLLLISDCPGTEADLFAWSRVTGNQVIATEKRGDGGLGYYIRKGRPTRPRPTQCSTCAARSARGRSSKPGSCWAA